METVKTRHRGGSHLWSDGVHYVRRATQKDRHRMRYVVSAHKTTTSPFKRHAPTEDAAIEAAKAATARWLVDHPLEAPGAAEQDTAPPEPSEAKPIVLAPFATTRFDCVYANPVAQVWMCTALPGEKKPIGRPRRGGRPAEQTVVPHEKGECAILLEREPVRNEDGSIRVYHTQPLAEEAAENLYRAADEETTISWKEGQSRVFSSPHFEVHFNPYEYGVKSPFIIWFPEHHRPVYIDSTRAVSSAPGSVPLKDIEDVELRFAAEEARARARQETRMPALETRARTFRSIGEAIDECERREKMLRGEPLSIF